MAAETGNDIQKRTAALLVASFIPDIIPEPAGLEISSNAPSRQRRNQLPDIRFMKAWTMSILGVLALSSGGKVEFI